MALAGLLIAGSAGCAAAPPAPGPSHAAATTMLPSAGNPARLSGRLLNIQDGDSFQIMTDDGQRLRVRIAGIDCPERGQPYAGRAREHLNALLAHHPIWIAPLKQDRYGRTIADVHNGTVDIGLAQIQAGMAWHYRRYADEQPAQRRDAYSRAQQQAREQRRGLWQDDAPLEPWALRARERRRHEQLRLSRP